LLGTNTLAYLAPSPLTNKKGFYEIDTRIYVYIVPAGQAAFSLTPTGLKMLQDFFHLFDTAEEQARVFSWQSFSALSVFLHEMLGAFIMSESLT
jgi:hypothetical protein